MKEEAKMLSIADVAAILNTSIPVARRKMNKIHKNGFIQMEDFVVWIEKHSSHKSYPYWVSAIERIERR